MESTGHWLSVGDNFLTTATVDEVNNRDGM
jgi:hypothetical protein